MIGKSLETPTLICSSSSHTPKHQMHWSMAKTVAFSSPRRFFPVVILHSSVVCQLHASPLLRKLSFRKYFSTAQNSTKMTGRMKYLNILDKQDSYSHIKWWMEKMQMCRKPSAIQLGKRLTHSNLLGLDDNLKSGSLKEGTLNFDLLQFKSRFPREVLLCRVGDFYEAIGFDACILVEHAGLNPFGGLRTDSIPKAGCPVVNLRQTLNDLTCNGFSVCIVEEVLGPTQARSRKGRFISGHAHPGSPYVFGLAAADDDVDFPEPMPVVGISRSAKGYCMVSVLETMKTFSEEDGLTEEALVTKLRTCHYHYLFLHTSLRKNTSGTCQWREFGEGGLLWAECKGKNFEWFDGNSTEEILRKVREIYGLDHDAKFRNVTMLSGKKPQPLYLGAATQIGVIPTEGIPSLLKVLLPSNCVGLPALYIRELLLNPPPYAVASAIQEACKLMASTLHPLPEFTCISAPKLVKLLDTKEVNRIEFCRIKNVVDEVVQIYSKNELFPIFQELFQPTWLATGLKIEPEILVNECKLISSRIGEMIFLDGETDQRLSSFELIPREFFDDMESSWKCHVKKIHAEEVFAEVHRSALALSNAVREDFAPIVTRVKSVESPLGGIKGEISYAREHGAIWFKGRRFMPTVWANTLGEEQIKRLRLATDSKGRKVGEEWFTTVKVEDALSRYHESISKAKAKVLEILRELSAELQSSANVLIFSSTLLIIAKALFAHVSEGLRRKWSFPQLVEHVKSEGVELSVKPDNLKLMELSPYWFDVAHGSEIRNNIIMQSMFLLTGPNGGGKSSLLRSICAAALLGICGLMVPAESAIIPHFDAVMLHMKAYDSPADGKSSFQIEMSELHSIINVATPRSLVLLDEICRGTETAKGTCIAGSVVETLDCLGCLGIVSTHLHGIFDLPLSTKNTVYKAMGADLVDGRIKPTWKLNDGVCRESLAFETAKKEGIPEKIIRRAEELYHAMDAACAYSQYLGTRLESTTPVSQSNVRESHTCSGNKLLDHVPSGIGMPSPVKSVPRMVENVVTEVCRDKFLELFKKKCILELPNVNCVSIGAREQPPPSTIGTSNVYVLFRPDDDKLYVGQTDDLISRVGAHRSKAGMQNSSFLYVTVPGKSIACELETLLIMQLTLKNFILSNKADGKHRNFGTSGLSACHGDSAVKMSNAIIGPLTAKH